MIRKTLALGAILASLAGASVVVNAAPAAQGPHQISRSEVRADTELWRRAGLAELHRGDQTPDVYSPEYQAKYAEYLRTRSGQEYQDLVKKYQNEAG